MSILLSEDEQQIVDRYLDKYKITNKSRWLRETILMFIYKKYGGGLSYSFSVNTI